jgi:predicted Ser/Thr protein kinase
LNSLEALRSGQLKGIKELRLSEGLNSFPKEIYTLWETLVRLDLTGNALDTLPDDFHRLKNLKILFLSDNNFTRLPEVLSKCPNLSMIGFRNNQITTIPENSLPLSTRWLILTDNALTSLPKSMGDLHLLQKCMLSGNKLTSLPTSMQRCHKLELLRIAVNELRELPSFLLSLPKLSWLAYGGNPFCAKHPDTAAGLKEISWEDLEIKELLGEGASGHIYKALYENTAVAVKLFKGEITSDGLPEEEMDINISIGHHDHLIDVLAKVIGHPEGKNILMLELIPYNYFNLGLPPTLQSCTRDVYAENFSLTLMKAQKILTAMASAAVHMHERGIMHGDFYAHNIMIDNNANTILGDFGGASYFEPDKLEVRNALERLEVRAFGCLIEEMLNISGEDSTNPELREKLTSIKESCLNEKTEERPLFKEVYVQIVN